MADKTDIWVYADWKGMSSPKCIGILSAQQAKGRKAFSFSYNSDWLNSREQILLDPVSGWRNIANQVGIPRTEQTLMSGAFKV